VREAFAETLRPCAGKVNEVNESMANIHSPSDANAYDRVTSSLSVQGVGWRGMNKDEIDEARGARAFTQHVFA